MSIVKVIELISQGATIEEAISSAVEEASKTIHNIRQVNVEQIEAKVENNKVSHYRVVVKVSFLIDKNH